MKSRVLPRLLLAIVPALLAASPREEVLSGDLAKLQGSWTTKAGPKRDIPVTMAIKGHQVIVDVASPLGLAIHAEGRLKIDESTSPKTIDWVEFSIVDGHEMPEVLGLYELKGDTFKTVNGGPNNGRPSEFKKGDGALADILVFSRAKTEVADSGAKTKK
ncbi:MAG: hypothetical protein JWN86_2058 [Planctomycetota bacterium]|nr:hypothetical protein [Planctomycetota bacterium]